MLGLRKDGLEATVVGAKREKHPTQVSLHHVNEARPGHRLGSHGRYIQGPARGSSLQKKTRT